MMRIFYAWVFLIFTLSLTACSTTSTSTSGASDKSSAGYEDVDVAQIKDPVPKREPKSKYGNPDSYEVFGETYYVKESADGFRERGLASWYGHPFHGRRTSSGEQFDMYKMTAAHKTVPIPSYMRVTNLDSGQSIIVRVNDRGPFHKGRVIDLSYVAAKKLGVHAKGTVPVEIAVVTPSHDSGAPTLAPAKSSQTNKAPTRVASSPKPHPNNGQPVFLQVAAFSNQQSAENVASALQDLPNNPGIHIKTAHSHNTTVHRVQIGPFDHDGQALQYSPYVQQLYPDTTPVVVRY